MGVHRDVALDPGEQVLAARHGRGHSPAGQISGREPWHPEVTARQNAASQRLVEVAGRPPDDITFRHAVSIPSWPGWPAAVTSACAGAADRTRCPAPLAGPTARPA